jgi:hypothetical protein
MYLDPVHFGGVARPMLRPVMQTRAVRPDISLAIARSRAAEAKPMTAPGSRYPMWSSCGNKPGSGSPCHSQAMARFNELKAAGHAWPQIQAIMQGEGSLRHYAGF